MNELLRRKRLWLLAVAGGLFYYVDVRIVSLDPLELQLQFGVQYHDK